MTRVIRGWTTRVGLYTKPPMSLNDRTHWRVKARHTREIRAWIREWATYHVPTCKAIRVELWYIPRDKRRRDVDNLVPTLKPAIDGLVDAGIVPDDTPDFVTWSVHVTDPNPQDPHLQLVVKEVS